jgi:hypothetical protein
MVRPGAGVRRSHGRDSAPTGWCQPRLHLPARRAGGHGRGQGDRVLRQARRDRGGAVFVVDYLIRFYLAPNRKYFLSHNLLDLLIVVVPFFRSLRALRLVRLLQLGRVLAIGSAVMRRGRSILTHRGLHFVLLA